MRAGESGSIVLGKRVAINSFAKLFGHGGITVGDDAQIGPGALLTTTTHDPKNQMKVDFRPISIGEWAWVGANATVISGVTIGRHSVIGAGSVVTNDIPDYSIAVGAPARVIGQVKLAANRTDV
ncbi:MAG: acyltransferase [Pseudomonadota bacterium]